MPPAPDIADLSLPLDDIASLFQPPVFDPFEGRCEPDSGVDCLIQLLRAGHVKPGQPARVTLTIPRRQITPELTAQTKAALERYCDSRLRKSALLLTVLRKSERSSLRRSLLVLVLCMLFSALALRLDMIPALMQRILSEGFMITGWVVMWRPIDTLLFESFAHRRDQRLFELIKRMDLKIAASADSELQLQRST